LKYSTKSNHYMKKLSLILALPIIFMVGCATNPYKYTELYERHRKADCPTFCPFCDRDRRGVS
jgi:hypothetical protein